MGTATTKTDAVTEFLKHHVREWDFHQTLGHQALNVVARLLKERRIKADLSSRAKETSSLEEKLRSREIELGRPFKDEEEIRKTMKDLAGVCIALTIPNDDKGMEDLLGEFFNDVIKTFPRLDKPERVSRQGSPSYKAQHYLVRLRNPADERYAEDLIEIQVKSKFVKATADFQHGLVYKGAEKLSQERWLAVQQMDALTLDLDACARYIMDPVALWTRSTPAWAGPAPQFLELDEPNRKIRYVDGMQKEKVAMRVLTVLTLVVLPSVYVTVSSFSESESQQFWLPDSLTRESLTDDVQHYPQRSQVLQRFRLRNVACNSPDFSKFLA